MFSFTDAQVLLNLKHNIMVVTFQSYWCVSGYLQRGRSQLSFIYCSSQMMLFLWEETIYHMSRWRIATPLCSNHLGPAPPSSHASMYWPQAKTLLFSPWGSRKCKLKLRFLRVFLWTSQFPSRQLICDDILSCDVEENYWNTIQRQVWCFMRPDGACTNPHCYNAICVWLDVIKCDNHPLRHGKMLCNYVFCAIFKRLQLPRSVISSQMSSTWTHAWMFDATVCSYPLCPCPNVSFRNWLALCIQIGVWVICHKSLW